MEIFVHVPPDNQILDPSKLEVKREIGTNANIKGWKKCTWCLRHLDIRLVLPVFFGHNSYLSSVLQLTHLQQSAQTFEDGTSVESTLSQHITSWEKRKNRACSPGVSRALIAQSVVRRRPGGFVRRWLGRWLQLCAGAKTKTRPATRPTAPKDCWLDKAVASY